ncbi:MAG: response regulator, partial [Lewinella sp.]
GMSITKQIVEMMGGTVSVHSMKGRGTTFYIELRLTKGNIEKLTGPTEENEHLLRGVHVLLVEDNMMNRFIATKSLTHFGCTVDEAENGAIALERLRTNQYDVILMDIQMPELDGVETTKIIRERHQLDVPIIAVTANAFKKDIDLYLSIGMNDYVTKPFEEKALFDTLVRYVCPSSAGALPEPDVTPGYDLTKLRELSRGDEDFVMSMVGIFVDQTPPALEEIREAMAVRDYECVGKTAHRIKPSIESMGIEELQGVAKEIELYARSEAPDYEVLTEKVDHLSRTLVRVIEGIRVDFQDALAKV